MMLFLLSNLYVLIVAGIVYKYLFFHPKRIYSSIDGRFTYINEAFRILLLFIVTTMADYQSNILFWGVYIVTILLINKKYNSGFHIVKSYFLVYYLFILWCFFTLFYSEYLQSGIMMIVKLIMPIFFYYLTKKALYDTSTIWILFEKIASCLYIYAAVGIISRIFGELLLAFNYFGMPISVIPLALYWKTKKAKYIILFFMCALPPLLALKRTPLLGIGFSTFFFLFCRYRLKAILPSVAAAMLSIVIFFSIPGFKERTFAKDVASEISIMELLNWDVFNYVSSSGRHEMWNFVIDKFYINHESIGCGLGTLKGYMVSPKNENRVAFTLLHNDWLHLLCETGKIGVCLLAGFFILFLFKAFKYSSSKYPENIRIISACCAGVIISTCIHMYFENCINSIIFFMPFVFLRIFQVCLDDYKKNLPFVKDGHTKKAPFR